MIKNANDGLRQRYAEATDGGLASGNFGVKPIDSRKGDSMGSPKGGMLKDGDRGAGMPIKHSRSKMPAQSQVDHGPHFAARSGNTL